LGTFTLVFVGAFAVVTVGAGDTDVVTPTLAHGLILIGLIFTFVHISGAHFNPAVTGGLLIGGNIDSTKAIAYLVIQLVGGIVAIGMTLAGSILAGSRYSGASLNPAWHVWRWCASRRGTCLRLHRPRTTTGC
jgi:glycerol uptake facilitator-like aquaporin